MTEGKSVNSTQILLVAAVLTAWTPAAAPQAQVEPRPVPLQPLPATQLDLREGRGALDGERLSLGFSEPTPIEDILLLLVRDTELSLVPDPALDQVFVGELKNVTIREALDLMLDPLGLDYLADGQVIRVFRREPETHLYSVDYVAVARADLDAPDLYSELAQGVRTLLSPNGRMNVDRVAALLQVTDMPARHARVAQYLETVMLRVTRQVQIDARVIEVYLRDPSASGIDWERARQRLGTAASVAEPDTGPSVSGTGVALRPGEEAAFLAALAEQGEVRVLSKPRVSAMNNAPVVVRVGTEVEPGTLADGFVLRVTPQISADGIVHMRISPSVREQLDTRPSRGASARPAVGVREADTFARVRQGDTVMITGLTRAREETETSRTPVIGHVPLLGQLFTRSETIRRRTDLVIALTPTAVRLGQQVSVVARRDDPRGGVRRAEAETR